MSEHAAVGAPPTWVLSNHDVAREVSRFGREQIDEPAFDADDLRGRPFDRGLGERRARAAALLMLSLPGGAYVYQGEELGLPEVEDLPDEVLQDPTWTRSGHTRRGRDGCRVPVPWSGSRPPFGFSPEGTTADPWLPQPEDWAALTVAAEDGEPDSMLALYRAALRLRRELAALGDGTLRWLDAPDGALAFARDPGFACVVNVSAEPVPLPEGSRVLLASGPLAADGTIGADTAVWLATSAG
jgi:alpha-glucosidase